MSFNIDISLSLSLKTGWMIADATALSQQSANDGGSSTPSSVTPTNPLSRDADTKEQVPCTPVKAVRPRLQKLRHHLHGKEASSATSFWNMVDRPIAETQVAKAKDRESLGILLQSTSNLQHPTNDGSQHNAPVSPFPHSGSSSRQLNKVAFPNMVPSQSSASSVSPAETSDSGSDLVSSLQRLRVGGLASYFEKLEKSASQHSSASRVSVVSASAPAVKGVEWNVDELAHVGIEDEDWEEMTLADASD